MLSILFADESVLSWYGLQWEFRSNESFPETQQKIPILLRIVHHRNEFIQLCENIISISIDSIILLGWHFLNHSNYWNSLALYKTVELRLWIQNNNNQSCRSCLMQEIGYVFIESNIMCMTVRAFGERSMSGNLTCPYLAKRSCCGSFPHRIQPQLTTETRSSFFDQHFFHRVIKKLFKFKW